MNNCTSLLKRKDKPYCKTLKRAITLNECRGCSNKTYREVKPIKKVSKKRVTVSKETYNEVFARDKGKCRLCGTTEYLEYHHILYRSERPDLIDVASNGTMLCGEFANNCHKGKAHKNKKKYQPLLIKMIGE